MLSWRLWYLSLFAFETTPQVDVIDPAGIVESMALQDAGRAIRVCLNASASERTLSSRFLDEFFGAGVQHIAFATDDIFAAAAACRAAGLELLPIPDNYYDDLEARLGLDPELTRSAARRRHPLRRGRGRALLPALHRGPSATASSSSSSSATATAGSARRTPRSGLPPRPVSPAAAPCRGAERRRIADKKGPGNLPGPSFRIADQLLAIQLSTIFWASSRDLP